MIDLRADKLASSAIWNTPSGMLNYHRNCVTGGTYFFTVNLLERRKRRLVEVEAIVLAVGWSGAIKSDADFWITTNKLKKCRVGRLFCPPFNSSVNSGGQKKPAHPTNLHLH